MSTICKTRRWNGRVWCIIHISLSSLKIPIRQCIYSLLRVFQWDVQIKHPAKYKDLYKDYLLFSPAFNAACLVAADHDDVIKWKHFPRYWPFLRGIPRSPVNCPHKGQRRGALMFSLICAWINGWVKNREAGDLRRHRAHYDVTVMSVIFTDAHVTVDLTDNLTTLSRLLLDILEHLIGSSTSADLSLFSPFPVQSRTYSMVIHRPNQISGLGARKKCSRFI